MRAGNLYPLSGGSAGSFLFSQIWRAVAGQVEHDGCNASRLAGRVLSRITDSDSERHNAARRALECK